MVVAAEGVVGGVVYGQTVSSDTRGGFGRLSWGCLEMGGVHVPTREHRESATIR